MGWYYLGSAYLPFDLQPLQNTASGAPREIYWTITHKEVVVPIPDEVSVFHEVGQMLATFLAAFAGGGVALWFDRCASCKPVGPSKEAAK